MLNFEGKAISSVNSVDEKRTSRTCLFMSSGYIHHTSYMHDGESVTVPACRVTIIFLINFPRGAWCLALALKLKAIIRENLGSEIPCLEHGTASITLLFFFFFLILN